MSQNTLSSGCKCVGVEESSGTGGIITALEVIEVGFLVVYVATVAERVDLAEGISKRSGGAQNVAIRVIFVAHNNCARSVHDGHYVTLEVRDVIMGAAVVGKRHQCSTILVEFENIVANRHLNQCTSTVDILVGGSTVSFLGSQM